jgi:Domain of unknown function (DUF4157)
MGIERLRRARLDERTGPSGKTADGERAAARPQVRGRTGAGPGPVPLPDDLRFGVETLSGFALDNVRVHYDSAEPSRVGALAYAQGTTIHVAPGQERHLPHEAWHVVQQAQGRVAPLSTQPRAPWLNTESALEQEAETMGVRASRIRPGSFARTPSGPLRPPPSGGRVVQRMKQKDGKTVINTLTALNAYLKQLNLAFRLGTDNFEEEPTGEALDQAIAASSMVVNSSTTRNQLVAELTTQLTAGRVKKPAKDPLAARKEAAKKCPTYKASKGSYYGGAANELHVHDVGGDIHVKVGADDRKNIYVNGKLRKDVLKESRIAISSHPLAATLNAAIDKALLAYGLDLDTY